MTSLVLSSDAPRSFEFDGYTLDVGAGELRKRGRRVRLPPQPMKVLSFLVENAGQTVDRKVLADHVWGHTVVDYDRSLNACIRKIRFALADDPESPRYVETIPRRGYRFIAPVEFIESVAPEPSRRAPVTLAACAALLLAGAVWTIRPSSETEIASGPAYDAFLKGSYHLNRGTEDSFRASERHFLDAIELEPAYGAALAGLARVYNELAQMGPASPAEMHARAGSAARQALDASPELVEAQLELALAVWFADWDWDGAGRLFEDALRQNPDNARLHHWYGYFLACRGRHPDSIRAVERALELDPLSREINADVGYFYYLAGDDRRAVAACERTLELEPDFPLARTCLVEANWRRGDLAAAAHHAAALMAEPLHGDPEAVLTAFDLARTQSEHVPAYLRAISHARRGEHEQALARLEVAIERRSAWVAAMHVDPALTALRRNPSYSAMAAALRVVSPPVVTRADGR